MNQTWIFIELGIIVLLIAIIIWLFIFYKRKKEISGLNIGNKSNLKKEASRRKKESDILLKKIDKELQFQKKLLSDLSEGIYCNFEGIPKTYINLSRESNRELHSLICDMFHLVREEKILYLRIYKRLIGSDSFFIITEKGFGYAPYRDPEEFLLFEDIKELIKRNGYIEFRDYDDVINYYVEEDDLTYDWDRQEKLINLLNTFLTQYKSKLDIFLDAGFEALENKLIPILDDIIEEVGNYNEGWKKILNANYKYLSASEGKDIKNNIRDAIYDIIDVKNMLKDDKTGRIYCMSELLRAKIMLLDPKEDHIEIKKIIDTVAKTAKDSDVKDEANKLRRELQL